MCGSVQQSNGENVSCHSRCLETNMRVWVCKTCVRLFKGMCQFVDLWCMCTCVCTCDACIHSVSPVYTLCSELQAREVGRCQLGGLCVIF